MNVLRLLTLCGITACLAAFPREILATLGETATSLESDRKTLKSAAPKVVGSGKFTVQELSSAASTVREYIAPNGIVFGIAWNGLAHPDLPPLLGKFAGEYRSARQQTAVKRGSRQSQVRSQRIVVQKWGHMRNLQGRAYAPELIPQGVTIDDIK